MHTPIKLADLDDVTLTASQGYRAMAKFLAGYFDRTTAWGQYGRWLEMLRSRAMGLQLIQQRSLTGRSV